MDSYNNTKKQYSELSKTLTLKLNKYDKKSQGIYFTPPETIYKNIKFLKPFMKNIKNILEPSCGSCEYILALHKKYPNIKITGVELNELIFDSIKKYNSDVITLFNKNFLNYEFTNTFDLIIGNPPYFVMKKIDVEQKYYKYFTGRPNIFILFIIKALQLLNTNGIISFVLPKNFLNCLYYDLTRKYIIKNYTILNIIECIDEKYIETKQNTIIIILQNIKPINNNNYSINISDYSILGTIDNISKLKKLYINSTNLYNLGFVITIGNVIWNQCKKILTDDNTKTLLIYSSDITDNKLVIKQYSNKEKKNYIDKPGNNETILVINRGYGVGSYKFTYCIINEVDTINYLIENHLICIKFNTKISKEELIFKYKKIIDSFVDNKTKEFIELYFGNNAINTTELYKILPIYNM